MHNCEVWHFETKAQWTATVVDFTQNIIFYFYKVNGGRTIQIIFSSKSSKIVIQQIFIYIMFQFPY